MIIYFKIKDLTKKIITIILIFSLTACIHYNKFVKKDLLRDQEFGVVSFFNEKISGIKRNFDFDKKFQNELTDWGLNSFILEEFKNILLQNNFQTVNINFDPKIFSKEPNLSLQGVLSRLKRQNKNLPPYLIMVFPKNALKEIRRTELTGTGGTIGGLILIVALSYYLAANTYSNVKKEYDLPTNRIYKNIDEIMNSNLIMLSNPLFEFNKGTTICGNAFDLFIVDTKREKLIAYNLGSYSAIQLKKYYNLDNIDSFYRFTDEDRKEIKNECLLGLKNNIKKTLVEIKLIN